MPTPKSRKRKPPKRVLALPDLEHVKTAVLNSLSTTDWESNPVPLDPDHRQGGCINPPWATAQNRR
jgi:hypothetical protein